MDKRSILEILVYWNYWDKEIHAGVKRDNYLQELERISKAGEVTVLTGVRRSGKSTLLLQFLELLLSRGFKKENTHVLAREAV